MNLRSQGADQRRSHGQRHPVLLHGSEVLTVSGVSITLGGHPVLRDISFALKQGEIVGLAGPNGGGKTTLLRAIAGLVRPDRGTISSKFTQPGKRSRSIGYMPQGLDLKESFPVSTYDLVMMGRTRLIGPCRLPAAEDHRKVRRAMEALKVARRLWHLPVGALSGGQKRRAFLAMVLAGDNRLLLLDEPAEALDFTVEQQLYETLKEICAHSGISILLVSHELNRMAQTVHRLLVMNCNLYIEGKPDAVLQSRQLRLCFGLTAGDELK